MNTTKTVWLSYPEALKLTLHSFSYQSTKEEIAEYVIGESGKIRIKIEAERGENVGLLLLHTPSDYLYFSNGKIVGSFFGLSFNVIVELTNEIELIKNGEELKFYSSNREILTLSNPAFSSSTSFGFRTKESGKTYVEVF